MKRFGLAVLFLALSSVAGDTATVVTTCGTLGQAYTAGSTRPITVDTNGLVCS